MVEEGILAAIVPLIQSRETPAIVLRHAIRCVSCIGLGATEAVRRRMVSLRVMLHLQRVGVDNARIDEERAAGYKWTCPELARCELFLSVPMFGLFICCDWLLYPCFCSSQVCVGAHWLAVFRILWFAVPSGCTGLICVFASQASGCCIACSQCEHAYSITVNAVSYW